MIVFNKKLITTSERSSITRDIPKTPPLTLKRKLTKENKKFLKLIKVLK